MAAQPQSFWPNKKKRGKGPFSGRPMTGMGIGNLGNLGDQAQAAEKYIVEPGHRDQVSQHAPIRAGGPDVPKTRNPALDILKRDADLSSTVSLLPADRVSIMVRNISTTATRIDVGLLDRTDVLIANMSDVVIWINTHGKVGANLGFPLAPNTEVGAYNGGTFAMECTKNVEWYAVAASGATNMIIIVEAAR